jgi:hypothetical protein
VATQCVSGSNAYRGLRHQTPSIQLKRWASCHFSKERFLSLIRQQSDELFDTDHNELTNNLINSWTGGISYGQAAKLVNLGVRCGCQSWHVDDSEIEQAVRKIHIPLDRYVLAVLRVCARGFSKPILNIPKYRSMGFMESYDEYKKVQDGIREIARLADVPPVVIDHAAWDVGHEASLTL